MSYDVDVEIDLDDPAAIFAEPHGEAHISADSLGALPDGGASFARAITLYVEAHPKLDVVTMLHTSAIGDGLVVRWRWRK